MIKKPDINTFISNAKDSANISASESASTYESVESDYASKSASTLKIKKGSKKSHRTVVTYRLNVSTIERIEALAREAEKGINETVQELLDLALDNIEIE